MRLMVQSNVGLFPEVPAPSSTTTLVVLDTNTAGKSVMELILCQFTDYD